jgi:coproporphyrinogen III oxidase-like Fe-S oxidoreductase
LLLHQPIGMPVQTDESFLHSVRAVVELGVQTVTLYPLTVRRRAPLGKQGV